MMETASVMKRRKILNLYLPRTLEFVVGGGVNLI